MIPLMKSTFLNEYETKKALCEFLLKTNRLSLGEKCFEFEEAFALKQERKHAILFNSGGSANLAMLQALRNLDRISKNDRIGFSALTWSTNTMPIIQMGCRPVAIDCDIYTLNTMSDNIIARLRDADLKAVFITNALGFLGDLDRIRDLCTEKNIILLEDNCESLGSAMPAGKAGNFGLASTFSFFVAHHMSTIEGGMVCTDDDELDEMLRIVRANGWDRNLNSTQQFKWRRKYGINSEFEAKYSFYDLGFNLRPTEITGFLGLYQLQYLDNTVEIRENNYLKIESIISQNDELILLNHEHITTLSTFAFPIVGKSKQLREKYLAQFSGAGVEIRPMIAGNMQKQPFYAKYVDELYSLPGTDYLHECGFYCGNYPELTDDDIELISSCLLKK